MDIKATDCLKCSCHKGKFMKKKLSIMREEYRPYREAVLNCMEFYFMLKIKGVNPPAFQMTKDLTTNYFYYTGLSNEERMVLSKNPGTRAFLDFSKYFSECFYDSLSEKHRKSL